MKKILKITQLKMRFYNNKKIMIQSKTSKNNKKIKKMKMMNMKIQF